MAEAGKELKVFDAKGHVVGTIVSLGDDYEDMKLAHQLFKDLGLGGRELSEVERLFDHAMSFYKVAHLLFSTIGALKSRAKYFVAPLAVNTTFAIELYLKTIAKQNGLELRGHKLLELYEALPDEVVSRIESMAAVVIRDHDIASADLRLFLTNLNDTFVRWRYAHEFEGNHFQVKQAMFLLDLLNRFAKADMAKLIAGSPN